MHVCACARVRVCAHVCVRVCVVSPTGLTRGGAGLVQCFKDSESNKVKPPQNKLYYILISQKSLVARRRATRTSTSLQQMEMMVAYTSQAFQLPRRKRIIYNMIADTNEAEAFGPVELPLLSKSWCLTFAKKKELFMTENRNEVGWPTDAMPQPDG